MKDENGENRKKAIKINRKTGKPFIIDEWQESPYWIVLVIQDNFEVPNWAKDKIYYQIFADRFYKSKYQAGNIVIGQKCLIGEKMKLEIIITMISLVETSKELKKN